MWEAHFYKAACPSRNTTGHKSCRFTAITASLPFGTPTLGLNAFGLDIRSVKVNGTPVPFQVVPYAWEPLPESVLCATGTKLSAAYQSVAEDTATEYRRFLQQERQAELICQARYTPVHCLIASGQARALLLELVLSSSNVT